MDRRPKRVARSRAGRAIEARINNLKDSEKNMLIMTYDDDRNCVRREVADPVRKEDEILIGVRAAALNRADLLQREGNYPPPPGWPEWPGLEVAGTVLEAPEACGFRPGDAVCALLGGGGYAEKVAVPAGLVLPVPAGMDFVRAAALPEVYATAWLNLHREAGIKSGDTVFIQAGASGLGLAAIQLAKLAGARVVATVGSRAKGEFVRRHGADTVVERGVDDLEAALAANPPDIALDCVGGPGLNGSLQRMAPGGRWIVIATLGGALAEIDLGVLFRRGVRLIGSSLRSRSNREKNAVLNEMREHLWPLFASGDLAPVIHRVLPLELADEAQSILMRNENIGKVVLNLQNSR